VGQDLSETGNCIPECKGIRISTGRNPAVRAMVRNTRSDVQPNNLTTVKSGQTH
jgi:hypothetical protein